MNTSSMDLTEFKFEIPDEYLSCATILSRWLMKVYLSCPIVRGRRLGIAKLLNKVISKAGHDVISKWLLADDPDFNLSPWEVYERDTKWVRESDLVIADVSNPSHGVGMEIMLALTLGKPVIAIARRGIKISRMLEGAPNITWVRYSSVKSLEKSVKKVLKGFPK